MAHLSRFDDALHLQIIHFVNLRDEMKEVAAAQPFVSIQACFV